MSPGTFTAFTLLAALTGTAIAYALSKPLNNSSDEMADGEDDAGFDPRIAELGRRVGGLPPFHREDC